MQTSLHPKDDRNGKKLKASTKAYSAQPDLDDIADALFKLDFSNEVCILGKEFEDFVANL